MASLSLLSIALWPTVEEEEKKEGFMASRVCRAHCASLFPFFLFFFQFYFVFFIYVRSIAAQKRPAHKSSMGERAKTEMIDA